MGCYFCIIIGGLNFNAPEQLIYCTDNSTCNLLKSEMIIIGIPMLRNITIMFDTNISIFFLIC